MLKKVFLIILVFSISCVPTSSESDESGWFHMVPVGIDSARLAEPDSIHHEVDGDNVFLFSDDGYLNMLFSKKHDTVFYDTHKYGVDESYLRNFDCRNGSTVYIYHHGWNVYWDCTTQKAYASQVGYPTDIVSLTSSVIPGDVEWVSLNPGEFTRSNWWVFRPEPDGSTTLISPLGELLHVGDQVTAYGNLRAEHASAWMFQVGESKILLRQTASGWEYAQYK